MFPNWNLNNDTNNLPEYWKTCVGYLDISYPYMHKYSGCYSDYDRSLIKTFLESTLSNVSSDIYTTHTRPWRYLDSMPVLDIDRQRGFRVLTWLSKRTVGSGSNSNGLKNKYNTPFFTGNGTGKNLIVSYSIIEIFPDTTNNSKSTNVKDSKLLTSTTETTYPTINDIQLGGNCCCDNILIAERTSTSNNVFTLTKVAGSYPIRKNDLFTVIFNDSFDNSLGTDGYTMVFDGGSGSNGVFDETRYVACAYRNANTSIGVKLPAPIIGLTPETGNSYVINGNGYTKTFDPSLRSGTVHTFLFEKAVIPTTSEIYYLYGDNFRINSETTWNNALDNAEAVNFYINPIPSQYSEYSDYFKVVYCATKVGDFNDNVQITQGNQGVQGIEGIQGRQGTRGLQGIQGNTGSTGLQGRQGIQGIKGDTGETGSTGLQGRQGIQGIKGDTGGTGTTGLQGRQGIQGIKGTDGSAGSTGLQGRQGTTGLQGRQGIQGIIGIGLQGIQGISGNDASGGEIPLLKNLKFISRESDNSLIIFERSLKAADSHNNGNTPLLLNYIRFQIDASDTWLHENILTNNGALPSGTNATWGIRFERVRKGKWSTINTNNKLSDFNQYTICTNTGNTPINAYNMAISGIGTLTPAAAQHNHYYMVPMDLYGFNFDAYYSNGIEWFLDKTVENVDLWYIPFTSEHISYHPHIYDGYTSHVFTLKSVNTKTLMDSVTNRMYPYITTVISSYNNILRNGSNYNNGTNIDEWFTYNNKRIYIGGQNNMSATYSLKTNPSITYTTFSDDSYTNTHGQLVNIAITNRFSFTCRIGLCTFKNTPVSISYTPYTVNWINFNVILGLTHFENSQSDNPPTTYGSNSNLPFIRGKVSKGKVPC